MDRWYPGVLVGAFLGGPLIPGGWGSHLWRGHACWRPSSRGSPMGRGALMPGGGVTQPTSVGAPATPALVTTEAATSVSLPCGAITCWDGPPTL